MLSCRAVWEAKSIGATRESGMAVIKYIKGDATQPQAKGNKIIAHVCNDEGEPVIEQGMAKLTRNQQR